ncbi:Abhydrolase-3 domain-containing protein [Mycena venus]|uniref:Abhydrolase-3 domain-containing protein n=1 Tax=Mycena venus TaxID=2733690 RepID=A0A8H6U0J2_9AGAR|nr:Abhydrolase-3 domain-containing protein [Mycena venus]
MSHPTIQKKLSWRETFGMVAVFIPLPVVLLWTVATTAYASYNKERSLKRIVAYAAMRYVMSNLSVPQMKAGGRTTLGTYEKWAKAAELPVTIDELGEDARLLWIGPRRLERVVLYLHGGAFLFPPGEFALTFWRYVQLELEKQNIEVGIAMLNYSGLALDFLVAAGVKPQNLQVAGDSAGGNLVIQVLSQMLHPLQRVPKISLSAPLRGMLIVSPSTNLTRDKRSYTENEGRDCITLRALENWSAVVPRAPEADRAYREPVHAPEGWFEGADRLVDRVLVTAGGAELGRDDIVVFGEVLKKHHPDAKLVVQKNGVHCDMLFDFMTGDKLGSLTPLLVEWLAAGFTNS